MPSPKATSCPTGPENGTEMASRNYEDMTLLMGWTPNSKHKKRLKKMEANKAQAVSVHAEAIKVLVKPEDVKPKIPKGIRGKLRKHACACSTKCLRLCLPKAKAKSQPDSSSSSGSSSGLLKAPKPHEGPGVEASMCQ
ncbi:hypothetical protein HPG69_010918, partial [Diceros bicornis minor]